MNDLQRMSQRKALKDALIGGSSASVLSAVALAVCSKREENRFAAGLNGPSQWLWGEHAAYARRLSVKRTLVGYLIHHAASIFWAGLYNRVFRDAGEKPVSRILAEATGTSVAAYIVDYKVTPKRLRPGFEKHINARSMVAVYAAFAIGLAAATLWRRK
jgi:hypothetical protein